MRMASDPFVRPAIHWSQFGPALTEAAARSEDAAIPTPIAAFQARFLSVIFLASAFSNPVLAIRSLVFTNASEPPRKKIAVATHHAQGAAGPMKNAGVTSRAPSSRGSALSRRTGGQRNSATNQLYS